MLTICKCSPPENAAASPSVFCFNQVKRCDPDTPSSLGSLSWRCEQNQWRKSLLPAWSPGPPGAPAGRVSPGESWRSRMEGALGQAVKWGGSSLSCPLWKHPIHSTPTD